MPLGLTLAGPKLTLGQSGKSFPTPKIKALHIKPIANGIKVTHIMTHGKPVEFSFQNPALMSAHLKRIQKNEWLHPTTDPAKRITSVLDLGRPA